MIQHIINISQLSNHNIQTQCIDTLIEITNNNNIIIKYSLKIFNFSYICLLQNWYIWFQWNK
jgi:hypothetical protein